MDQPSFEHEAIEKDMQVLAQEIAKSRELPENESVGEKELLRQAIRSLPQMSQPAPAGQPKAVPQAALPTSKSPLPGYAQSAPPEVKLEIEYLLDLAFHHGIARADAEARKSPDFVLDTFHDTLVGKLYPELKKRGMLK